jgi:hypothetical protein
MKDFDLNRNLANENRVGYCTSAITWLDRMDFIGLLGIRSVLVFLTAREPPALRINTIILRQFFPISIHPVKLTLT